MGRKKDAKQIATAQRPIGYLLGLGSRYFKGDGFNVLRLNLVANLDFLEYCRIVDSQLHYVHGTAQRDCLRLRIDRHDIGHNAHRPLGSTGRLVAQRSTDGLLGFDALADTVVLYLAQFQGSGIGQRHQVTDVDLVKVADLLT